MEVVEALEAIQGALAGDGVGAKAGELRDSADAPGDIGALGPEGDGGDGDAELFGEIEEGDGGIEKSLEERRLDLGGDGVGEACTAVRVGADRVGNFVCVVRVGVW